MTVLSKVKEPGPRAASRTTFETVFTPPSSLRGPGITVSLRHFVTFGRFLGVLRGVLARFPVFIPEFFPKADRPKSPLLLTFARIIKMS